RTDRGNSLQSRRHATGRRAVALHAMVVLQCFYEADTAEAGAASSPHPSEGRHLSSSSQNRRLSVASIATAEDGTNAAAKGIIVAGGAFRDDVASKDRQAREAGRVFPRLHRLGDV